MDETTVKRSGCGPVDRHASIIKDEAKSDCWYVEWYDHAFRLIRRRLGKICDIGTAEKDAIPLARGVIQAYIDNQQALWQLKQQASAEEIADTAQRAAFPREVVAREILRICDQKLARDVNEEARNGRPGLQLFADRVGISSREVHRIIEDPRRITVGIDAVDKICCEFDMLFDDFIESALQWADRTGAWTDRVGQQDPWPFGYVTDKAEQSDII